jgi:hypothetical protein
MFGGKPEGANVFRRITAVVLTAALAVPLVTAAPAPGAILFSCTSIDDGSFANLAPGLHHDQMAQTDVYGAVFASSCSNADTMAVFVGSYAALGTVASYPSRPLGCPEALGGAGPDYADQTPILLGPTDPSFSINWGMGGNSSGIAKAKSAGPTAPGSIRLVFNITSGLYVPPAGQKTKVKGMVSFTPFDSYSCADNSDPIESVDITSGTLLVQQK